MSSEENQDIIGSIDNLYNSKTKLEDFNVPEVENGTSFDEKISSEIPLDVDTRGVVIDKAPSLSTDSIADNEAEAISQEDISDLMAELMSSMDTNISENTVAKDSEIEQDTVVTIESGNNGDTIVDSDLGIAQDTVMATESGMDQETIEAGKALEEYLNSPVEQLINHPEMPASFDLEIPDLEKLDEMIANDNENHDNSVIFPELPQMPDIPEVVERIPEEELAESEENTSDGENNNEFAGFNLEPITVENFNERFDENEEDSGVIEKLKFDSYSEDDIEAMKKELAESESDEADEPSESDIEALLANAQKEALAEGENRETGDMSLEELLMSSNDSKAEAIGELLDKAERNEAVDEGISALLSGENLGPEIHDVSEIPENNVEELDPRAAKKAEKLRRKEEKKEARRKAKEEKLAAKNARKQKKSATADNVDNEGSNKSPLIEIPSVEQIAQSGLEHKTDMSDIEALLAGADAEANGGETNPLGVSGNLNNAFDNSEENDSGALAALIGADIQENSSVGNNEPSGNEIAELLGNDNPSGESEVTLASLSANSSEIQVDGEGIGEIPEKSDKEKKENPLKAFFGKIVDFLTEEDEEEGDEKSEIILSEENTAILEELDKESAKGKKKKKKNKKSKKASSGNEENPEDLPEKKPAKKKKEKKPKQSDENEKPEPKISKKKIVMVALVCLMLGGAIFTVTYFTADYTVKKSGRDAYNNEDYQTCYQNLYGKKLTETEAIMYNQSECILKIKLWLREYEVLAEDGQEAKALDSLIQSVNTYPKLKQSAEEWGCLDKVEPIYDTICEVLNNKYGLSEQDALEIAAQEDDVVYTRLVNAISSGVDYKDALNYILTDDISGNTVPEEKEPSIPANMEDLLPEEENVSGGGYIEP